MSYSPDGVPQRGWFSRNWLWFVPVLLVFLGLLVCGGGCVLSLMFSDRLIALGVPEIDQAVSTIQGNAEAREALGEPIERDGMPTRVEQNVSGQTITREIGFNVKGPKGTASVDMESETVGTTPTLKRIDVTLSDGRVLHVLESDASDEAAATSDGDEATEGAEATTVTEAPSEGSTESDTPPAPE